MAPNFSWTELIGSTAACITSITFLSAAFAGWFLAPLALWERFAIALAALPMIVATPVSVLAGLVIAAPVLLRQFVARKAALEPA